MLVCNAWAGYMPYLEHNRWFDQPFWEQSMERWDGMFTGGLRVHLMTARYGVPLMLPASRLHTRLSANGLAGPRRC